MIIRVVTFFLVIIAVPAILISLPVWAEDTKFTITVAYAEDYTGDAAEYLKLYQATGSSYWEVMHGPITIPSWTKTTSNDRRDSKIALKIGVEKTCSVKDSTSNVITGDATDLIINVAANASCVVSFLKPIRNCTDLQNMITENNYILLPENGDVIDCTGVSFTPIMPFKGNIVGDGKTIENLVISDHGLEQVGLFESFSGSIEDINFNHVKVGSEGSSYSIRGLIAGKSSGSVVDNINVTDLIVYGGSEARGSASGGIFGNAVDATLTKVVINDIQFTKTAYFGGLIGIAGNNVSIKDSLVAGWTDNACPNVSTCNCSNTSGTVCGAGGLIGYVKDGKVTIDSSATRPNDSGQNKLLTGQGWSGGLVGQVDNTSNTKLDITNSYSRLDVNSRQYAGGIIGYSTSNANNIQLTNVYSAGTYNTNYFSPNYENGSKAIVGGVLFNCCQPGCDESWCCDPNCCDPNKDKNCKVKTKSVVSRHSFFDKNKMGTKTTGSGDYNETTSTWSVEKTTAEMQSPSIYAAESWPTDIWCLSNGAYPTLHAIEPCKQP
ncbi:MAG: hypothetical protein ABSF18_01875 [Gammaproteobacteria bacterium]|jgi:hypothetical protein